MVQVSIRISEALAERLREEAQRRNLSLDEYAEKLLSQHTPLPDIQDEGSGDEPPPGSMAALAAAAKKANIRTGRSDISEHSREILEEEWGKHLSRWKDQTESSSDE